MNIKIPDEAEYIINALRQNGFDAYIVGGCVRDSLLGKIPKDWDICTPALPEQMKKIFENCHVIETGLQHGTLTIMLNHKPFEVTTYRVDGKYKDNRRPEKVKFVEVLKRDLARRDFTINAMAYNHEAGIVDYYGGQEDLLQGKIKCVGNAEKRFKEDALRIMRALRFAAVLGFTIDGDTARAMNDNRALLHNISPERIAAELDGLIVGDNVRELLSSHLPVLFEIIPELKRAFNFNQNTPYHCFDVLTHILASVDAAENDLAIRLAMLFHDIGKPYCYTESDGRGHFYGHSQKSCDIAKEILVRLKYDNDIIKTVTELVLYHDQAILSDRKNIKRWLNRIGEKRLRQLLEVKRADTLAQAATYHAERLAVLDEISALLDEVIKQGQCFTLKDLAVNGNDLISVGIKEGAEIGSTLKMLVEMVIDEQVANEKSELLRVMQDKSS